jgi:hypothetical protein
MLSLAVAYDTVVPGTHTSWRLAMAAPTGGSVFGLLAGRCLLQRLKWRTHIDCTHCIAAHAPASSDCTCKFLRTSHIRYICTALYCRAGVRNGRYSYTMAARLHVAKCNCQRRSNKRTMRDAYTFATAWSCVCAGSRLSLTSCV